MPPDMPCFFGWIPMQTFPITTTCFPMAISCARMAFIILILQRGRPLVLMPIVMLKIPASLRRMISMSRVHSSTAPQYHCPRCLSILTGRCGIPSHLISGLMSSTCFQMMWASFPSIIRFNHFPPACRPSLSSSATTALIP